MSTQLGLLPMIEMTREHFLAMFAIISASRENLEHDTEETRNELLWALQNYEYLLKDLLGV